MALVNSPIPSISISPAPLDEPLVEPFSPFDAQTPLSANQGDSYRPSLLSPPPVISPRFHRQPSPLRPADTLPTGQGLDRSQFEALLASTKERNASSKKSPDLRKEIALKAHKSKQMERRALFLSKVNAPPSPTATGLPKTPPESPAIFHYSLPSPGLVSPLALFESLQQKDAAETAKKPPVQPWVEQVEYRRPQPAGQRLPKGAFGFNKALPSLDQITARLSSHGYPTIVKDEHRRSPIPLPTFLRAPRKAITPALRIQVAPASPTREHPREHELAPREPEAAAAPPASPMKLHAPAPKTPISPVGAKLHVTTTLVPRSCSASPTMLSEGNLHALNSRALTGRDMMSKLQRRMAGGAGAASATDAGPGAPDEDERRARRISAPAELPRRERHGFAHPVLALPGAF
ncbi:hypothetical protein BC834DRAFT_965260 [Gloeopeniophorella convolvens]|nr:hypothetical protein BC834DRAFT_965260 [Gloeopeniophorella convolvens]